VGEEVSIGRDEEVSIERLSAEAIGVGSGKWEVGREEEAMIRLRRKEVVGLGGGRRL